MIVPKQVIAGILAGKVTTIRVPLDVFKLETWRDQNGDTQIGKPSGIVALRSAHDRPEGHSPSKPAPAGKPLCSLRILNAERVSLDAITEDEARADGYSDPDEYSLAYMATYARSWTDTEGWLLTFEINKREPAHLIRGPWDPGSDGTVGPERERAPEPEKVSSTAFARDARAKWERDQAQREALYRAMPLADKLRLVQQDQRLRILGRDDLRVIERRLEAIWNRGNKAA
jgi:hypothetical protein